MQISLGNIAFKLVTRRANEPTECPDFAMSSCKSCKRHRASERERKRERAGEGRAMSSKQLSGKLAAIKRDINCPKQVASIARECNQQGA